ncbi:MAG: hypothetical protein IPF87_18225 [Gemmatimonadetes bacterium]|nr:hypothetical protein [Gemmatimonadota bacterium]
MPGPGNGPVVFVAEDGDRLQLVVGRNPAGSVNQVKAAGQRFLLRMVADRFVIDQR